jgi:hypothetical protein
MAVSRKTETVDCALLRREMTRLTSEVSDAETVIGSAQKATVELESVLDRALLIAGNCARAYNVDGTPPAVRRMFNQGLFKALYIGEGGGVDHYELNSPFDLLIGSQTASASGEALAAENVSTEVDRKLP